jgi:hypothetical protein
VIIDSSFNKLGKSSKDNPDRGVDLDICEIFKKLENPSTILMRKLDQKSPEHNPAKGPDLMRKLSKSEGNLRLPT